MRSVYLAVLTVLLSSSIYGIINLYSAHTQLLHAVNHHYQITTSNHLQDTTIWPSSAPDLSNSEFTYQVFLDTASKTIAASALSSHDKAHLLTAYLRNNFCKFSSLPQAFILKLLADDDAKHTFDPAYVSKLDFHPPDLLAGTYRVVLREPERVEFSMVLGNPGDVSYIQGRLVISVDIDEGLDTATFTTRTFMWRRLDSDVLMPMEQSVPRWMHKVSSMWLIDQGTKYLVQP